MRPKSRRSALVYPESGDPADAVTNRDSASFYAGNPTPTPHHSASNSQFYPASDIYSSGLGSEANESCNRWQKAVKRVVNSWMYSVTSITLVVFTLFGDSVRLAATGKEADVYFTVAYLVSFCFFLVECGLLFAARVGYRWSLSFWFDLLSTLVLVTYIAWLWPVPSSHSLSKTGVAALHTIGNTSRITSRTLRFVRFFRLFRLLHVTSSNPRQLLALKSDSALAEEVNKINQKKEFEKKLRKMSRRSKPAAHRLSTHSVSPLSPEESKDETGIKRQRTFNRLYEEKKKKSKEDPEEELNMPMESKVSKTVSERTMRQVFFIVILAVILMPTFNPEMYGNSSHPHLYCLELLELTRGQSDFLPMLRFFVEDHSSADNLYTLIELTSNPSLMWRSAIDPSSLRSEELEYCSTTHIQAIFDIRTKTQTLAAMEIALVAFLCIAVLLSGLSVTCDFSSKVLLGLERMMVLTKKIAQNPLLLISSSQDSQQTIGIETVKCCCCANNSLDYGATETQLLEEALKKIGVMLVLGLGTAGCEIITRNIRAAGRINPMIPGKKVLATFCFISIRGFDVLTDMLGPALLIYVNMISQVVHSYAERYQGAINRNLGESFFAIWKFDEDDAIHRGAYTSVNAYSMSVRLRAALALIASIKSIAKVSRSRDLSSFLSRCGMGAPGPFLCEQLSVGLHVGWAFEGPVGSAFKIDATYLSPHVNKTARLESATRLYDVSILASDDFIDRLDDEIKSFFRHIDTVVLKGTTDAVRLYTFDIVLYGLGPSAHKFTKAVVQAQKEKIREAFEFNYFNVHELFTQSEKLAKMRSGFGPEFFRAHKEAMVHYIEGRWLEAKDVFYRCLRLVPMDGPSLTVLHFMEKWGFQHPEGWDGVRVLASK